MSNMTKCLALILLVAGFWGCEQIGPDVEQAPRRVKTVTEFGRYPQDTSRIAVNYMLSFEYDEQGRVKKASFDEKNEWDYGGDFYTEYTYSPQQIVGVRYMHYPKFGETRLQTKFIYTLDATQRVISQRAVGSYYLNHVLRTESTTLPFRAIATRMACWWAMSAPGKMSRMRMW